MNSTRRDKLGTFSVGVLFLGVGVAHGFYLSGFSDDLSAAAMLAVAVAYVVVRRLCSEDIRNGLRNIFLAYNVTSTERCFIFGAVFGLFVSPSLYRLAMALSDADAFDLRFGAIAMTWVFSATVQMFSPPERNQP